MDPISSTQNTRVKLVNQLQTRPRARLKERKIVLEGARLIRDGLQAGRRPLFMLYALNGADYLLVSELQEAKVEVIPVTPAVMQHLSETRTPSGMLAVFPLPEPRIPDQPGRTLILDGIADPGNLGTILRTATAAGVELVIQTPGGVDIYNPKTLRAGMGAQFRVPVAEASWTRIQEFLPDVPLYVATGGGTHAYTDVDWRSPWALVIGNEAHGVQVPAGIAHTPIMIPMEGGTESLNAAIAAGVLLFEAQRQRRA
jgi:RNA methyltransferase, TrmH family